MVLYFQTRGEKSVRLSHYCNLERNIAWVMGDSVFFIESFSLFYFFFSFQQDIGLEPDQVEGNNL